MSARQGLASGGNAVFNVLAVDPSSWSSDASSSAIPNWLQVELHASCQWSLFSGEKCNLGRKRVAVQDVAQTLRTAK